MIKQSDVIKVQSITNLLPCIVFAMEAIGIDKFIATTKQRMIHDLFEEYPSIVYCEISFDLQKEGAELYEGVEMFKCADGRYIYKGDFVSREFLEKELSHIGTKLHMTALIKEKDNG